MRVLVGLLALLPCVQGLRLTDRGSSDIDTAEDASKPTGPTGHWCQVKTELPTRCKAGNDHWTMEEMRAAVPAFIEFWKTRPYKQNSGGANTNHAFALWFTIKQLKPKYIVESGVWHGFGTWLLRAAAGNDTTIISLDPHAESFLQYRDPHPRTKYFLGENWKDFSEMNWDELISKEDRAESTLVLLDDHQSAIRRTKELLDHGFVHLWYDDNYKSAPLWIGMSYSFNMMCSEVSEEHKKAGAVPYPDHFGESWKDITLEEHEANVKFVLDHTDVYFEFPALFDRCGSDRAGRTFLLPHIGEGSWRGGKGVFIETWDKGKPSRDLVAMGLPTVDADPYQYNTQYPPYVKLKP